MIATCIAVKQAQSHLSFKIVNICPSRLFSLHSGYLRLLKTVMSTLMVNGIRFLKFPLRLRKTFSKAMTSLFFGS